MVQCIFVMLKRSYVTFKIEENCMRWGIGTSWRNCCQARKDRRGLFMSCVMQKQVAISLSLQYQKNLNGTSCSFLPPQNYRSLKNFQEQLLTDIATCREWNWKSVIYPLRCWGVFLYYILHKKSLYVSHWETLSLHLGWVHWTKPFTSQNLNYFLTPRAFLMIFRLFSLLHTLSVVWRWVASISTGKVPFLFIEDHWPCFLADESSCLFAKRSCPVKLRSND